MSASQVIGITGLCHHTQPQLSHINIMMLLPDKSLCFSKGAKTKFYSLTVQNNKNNMQ
jgi:hypothetical protein